MSARKVDVLAVMHNAVSVCGCIPCPECDHLGDARTAVAELIAAADALVGPSGNGKEADLVVHRLRAALVGCRGE